MTKRRTGLELPSNNLESSNEGPSLSGTVRTRKSSATSTMANTVRDISLNLVEDIIIPEVKKIIVDFFTSAVESIVWGVNGGVGRGRGSSILRRDYSSYSNHNRGGSKRVKTVKNVRTNNALEISDIVFDNRSDAELVLATLFERLATYDAVRVADLYSVCGVTQLPIHSKYGWYELGTGSVRHTMDGYVLDLPEAVWLDG